MDNSTTIQQLKDLVEQFKLDRDWSKYHTPQDLAVSISTMCGACATQGEWKSEDC